MFNTLEDLQRILLEIKNNSYTIPSNIDFNYLVNLMIKNIGHIDPVVRDDLIYSILSYLIVRTDKLNNKLSDILEICLDDDHLFYKIGEVGTDSIFTRSFSMLLLATIIYNHRKNNIFSHDEVVRAYGKVKEYFKAEKDLRGFVEKKGWAHAVAHSADTLDEFALCSEIDVNDLKDLLQIFKDKICEGEYTYINEEDERLVTAVTTILSRKLITEEYFIDWIKEFTQFNKKGIYPYDSNLKINIKNFLRSLYFRLLPLENMDNYIETISKTLTLIQ